jgi:hypothetical protein
MFICFSVNGFAKGAGNGLVEPKGTISQSSSEKSDQKVFDAEGILQACVKVNEINNLTFQNFKTGKKYFTLALSCLSSASPISFYDSYFLLRINRFRVSPFYIAYHRLII